MKYKVHIVFEENIGWFEIIGDCIDATYEIAKEFAKKYNGRCNCIVRYENEI